MKYWFRLSLAGLALLVSACSDDDVLPPNPLPDYEETVSIRKLWSDSVSDGAEDYFLTFSPAVTDAAVYSVARDGTVLKLDRKEGDEIWEVETELSISGGVAAGFGRVVFGTSNGETVALSEEDGKQLWRVSVAGQVLSAPGISPDRVVVQTIDGRLHGLNAETGEQVWLYDTSIPILTSRGEASPMILGNIVLAGFANGKMVALQASDGLVGWEKAVAEPQGRSELERLVDIDGRFDVEDTSVFAATLQGKVASFDIPSGRIAWSKPFSSHAGLSVSAGSLFAVTDDSDIVAMDVVDGSEHWRQDKLKRRAVTAPVAYGNFVVAGDFEGYLHWMDRETGQFVARVRVDSDGLRAAPVVVDGVVYVQANDGSLAAYEVESADSESGGNPGAGSGGLSVPDATLQDAGT